jgi:hypothetical protein
MGWGTSYDCNIFISRKIFHHLSDLETEINDVKSSIENNKRLLLMYVSANPSDITPKDWSEDCILFLHNKIEELLEENDEQTIYLFKLEMLKENFNNGKKNEE